MALTTFSLDGKWDFYYSPQKFDPERDILPEKELFTGKMVTPGYWDDHYELFGEEDYFGLTARFNPDYRKPYFPMARSLCPHAASSFLIGSGFYRKIFSAEFEKNSKCILRVGPAMWGCAVFCNGKFAGKVTGYSTESRFSLDGLTVQGDNEIIIVVCNVHDDGGAYCRIDGSHDGEAFGARPGQHRGLAAQGYQSERAGIGGGVNLDICGCSRISDRALFYVDGRPQFLLDTVDAENCTVAWTISHAGNILDSGKEICSAPHIRFYGKKFSGPFWSDRDPQLCDVDMELYNADGELLDKTHFKWGARTLEADGTNLLLNGKAVYLRGVTEHCYFPETTNPHFDKEKYLRDLGIFKSAGINFIRCHTWCPPEVFYEACDELGIVVQTEFPSVYNFTEAEEIIRQVRPHACALILCEGNEKILCEKAIERLRRVTEMLHELAPGMLFNPQEASRGVEYALSPGRKVTEYPFPHDAERLQKISGFSDLFGSLGGGFFSYIHDEFPGVEAVEEMMSIYKKPCLSHEIGILGGYLDFKLETRYENTFIGTDLFSAARDNMKRNGVWEYAEEFYKWNTLFISSIRKQLVENIRSCPSITGYDFLGGIDTHWHLIGYPCGIFNEFYEEKAGDPIEKVRLYTAESVLLNSFGKWRNFYSGKKFSEKIIVSHYGENTLPEGIVTWSMETDDGKILCSGSFRSASIAQGSVSEAGVLETAIPAAGEPFHAVLRVTLEAGETRLENSWDIWFWEEIDESRDVFENVRVAEKLTAEDIAFMEKGGNILLTANFPGETMSENFRPHTSGRSIGHSGAIVREHPVWKRFPNEGFADWQFYPLMSGSTSFIRDAEMPEFSPMLELIPSFKLIRRKSPLMEFKVGSGRLLICGLNIAADDPAAGWMRHILLEYLSGADKKSAVPVWESGKLLARIGDGSRSADMGGKIDAGGRVL